MSDPHHDDEPATRRVPIEDVSEDAPTRIVPARQILDELSTVDDEPTHVVRAGDKAETGKRGAAAESEGEGAAEELSSEPAAEPLLEELGEAGEPPHESDAVRQPPQEESGEAGEPPREESGEAGEPPREESGEAGEPPREESSEDGEPSHDEQGDVPPHDEPHEDRSYDDDSYDDEESYDDELGEDADEPETTPVRPRRLRGCLVRAALIVVALALIGGVALLLWTRRDPLVTRPEVPPERVLIRNVRVIDVLAGKARPGMDVLLEGDKIHSVAPHSPTAKPAVGTTVIDGSGKSLIPGLIDIHCHLGNSPAPLWDPQLPDIDLNLERMLYSGVTRTLDPAAVVPDIFELRSELTSGERLGPTLYTAGPMFTAHGGHPVPMMREALPSFIADRIIEGMVRQVGSEEEVRAAIEVLSKQSPDFIKIAIDRIPLNAPRLDPALATAIVREAKARRLRVVAHIGTTEDALDAANAGVSAWVHGIYKERIPEEDIAKLAAFKIPMAPTLVVFKSHAVAGRGRFPSTPLERETVDEELLDARADIPTDFEVSKEVFGFVTMLNEQQKTGIDNVRRLHDAGVVIMAGSDCQSNVVHGPGLHREMALLSAADLPPVEVLRAATLYPARFLARDTDPPFGVIAAGKQADLVLIDGDPLAQPEAVSKIAQVILAGVPLKRHPLPSP